MMFEQEGYRLMGAAFEVYNELGYGMAELKAVQALTADHEAQLFNYLRAARINVGYLLNFGSAGQLEWKRFIITDHKNSYQLILISKFLSVILGGRRSKFLSVILRDKKGLR